VIEFGSLLGALRVSTDREALWGSMRPFRVGFQKNPLFIRGLLAPSAPPNYQGKIVTWELKFQQQAPHLARHLLTNYLAKISPGWNAALHIHEELVFGKSSCQLAVQRVGGERGVTATVADKDRAGRAAHALRYHGQVMLQPCFA
jgi:hypothetical protein